MQYDPVDEKWDEFSHWDIFEDGDDNWSMYSNPTSDVPSNLSNDEIVKLNVGLLGNKKDWKQAVGDFNALLNEIESVEKREEIKQRYQIRFDGAEIDYPLDFSDQEFPCKVVFREVKFNKSVNFTRALFKGHAIFDNITIDGDANFTRTKFVSDFFFRSNKSIQNLKAKELKVEGNLEFSANVDAADFQGLCVSGSSYFSGSRFETVPDFRDSKLDRPPEVAGMIVPPPIMNPFRWFKFTKSKDEEDVAKYRKLKAMALAANDHEKDGEFFGYEIMAKRGHETTGFWPLLLNSLYWRWSNYGQSIWRPFKAMLRSWGMFSVINMIIVLCSVKGLWSNLTLNFVFPIEEILFSISHSFYNVVPLIGGLFRTAAIPDGHDSWYDKTYHYLADNDLNIDVLTAFSALQQFLGIIFLFLLILGLRNKFRLK